MDYNEMKYQETSKGQLSGQKEERKFYRKELKASIKETKKKIKINHIELRKIQKRMKKEK